MGFGKLGNRPLPMRSTRTSTRDLILRASAKSGLCFLERRRWTPNANRKAFQDADHLAKVFARDSRNEEILDLQKHIDEDTRDVLSVAASRMNILLKDKSHFLHPEKPLDSPHKVPLIQQKRELLHQFETRPDLGSHSWHAYRSGVRCEQCKLRLHSKSLVSDLKAAMDSTCDMAAPKTQGRKTRFQVIEELIAAQEGIQSGVHHLKLDKAYLRCTECASYILARCKEDAFNSFVGGACHVGPLEASLWQGHPSHTMCRKGSVARCTRCNATGRIRDGQLDLNDKLNKRCSFQRSQDMRSCFT